MLDVFTGDPTFGELSRQALKNARARGGLVACDVVWAETAAAFGSRAEANAALDRLGVDFSPLNVFAAVDAGVLWRTERGGGGRRLRIVADFLIGSHAAHQADCLLSRDRGFYRQHFEGMTLIDPSAV